MIISPKCHVCRIEKLQVNGKLDNAAVKRKVPPHRRRINRNILPLRDVVVVQLIVVEVGWEAMTKTGVLGFRSRYLSS